MDWVTHIFAGFDLQVFKLICIHGYSFHFTSSLLFLFIFFTDIMKILSFFLRNNINTKFWDWEVNATATNLHYFTSMDYKITYRPNKPSYLNNKYYAYLTNVLFPWQPRPHLRGERLLLDLVGETVIKLVHQFSALSIIITVPLTSAKWPQLSQPANKFLLKTKLRRIAPQFLEFLSDFRDPQDFSISFAWKILHMNPLFSFHNLKICQVIRQLTNYYKFLFILSYVFRV